MFTRGIAWVGALTALLLLAGPSGADNCNNECRMRRNFYSCPQNFCMFMDRAECARCTLPGYACDKANPVVAGTCNESGTNQVKEYTGCLLNCSCDGRTVIEAQDVEILGGTWIGCKWWRCYLEVELP